MSARGLAMRRTAAGFEALDDEARRQLDRIPEGKRVLVSIRQPRSYDQLKLYWKLLDYVAEAAGYDTSESLLNHIKVALGHYDICRLPNGQAIVAPGSISFDEMSQAEFQEFFNNSVVMIVRDLMPHMTREDLVAEIERMVGATIEPDPDQEWVNGSFARNVNSRVTIPDLDAYQHHNAEVRSRLARYQKGRPELYNAMMLILDARRAYLCGRAQAR